MRGLLHELPKNNGSIVVVDTEASPEHLSRSTTEAVDLMLVVAEPYFKSLETARRYYGMGKELGIPHVAVLANKVRRDDDVEAIKAFCGERDLEMFAAVPFDEAMGEAERAGIAPVDFNADSPSVKAIDQLAHLIVETSQIMQPAER